MVNERVVVLRAFAHCWSSRGIGVPRSCTLRPSVVIHYPG